MNAFVSRMIAGSLLSFSLLSCSDSENDKPDDSRSNILRSKTFAGISDSIAQWPSDPKLVLTRATRLSQNNYHKAATPDYKKAYELTGDEGVALEYASNLLLAGDTEQALQLLKEGASRFEDNTEFNRRLAEIYIEQGNINTALEEYEILLAKDSTNFEAWYDKGSLLLQSRDTAAATEALERSFAILPINHSGMMLANIYVAKKNPRALEICNTLIQNDSSGVQVEPVYMKGVYYAETKNYAKAIEQFDECIRRDWKTTDAYIEKGIVYYEQKKYDEALKVFNLASTVSNTDADVYFWIGRSEEAKGNKQQAIASYRRALALDDSFTEAKDALRRLNS